MAEQQPNILFRFIRGIWLGVDFSRRLVMNGIFVLLLLLFIAALSAGGSKSLGEHTALVIAPSGAIVEQYSISPADRAAAQFSGDEVRETQLRDLLAAIDGAAKDSRIDRIVLETDRVSGAGMSTLIEVGAALDRFRKSGKEVIAYGDAFEQRGYYLAAHADKVYLNPEGAVMLEGLGRYRTFYKGALDKLGIEAHLFRVGEYKSAGEPYIRTNMSDDAREADLYWLGDLWERFLGDIGTLRGIDPKSLKDDIEHYTDRIKEQGGDLAKLALQQKLVDDLKTRDQVRALLIEKGAKDDEGHSYRRIDLADYVKQLALSEMKFGKPKLAVVVAEGEIVDGKQPGGTIGGDSTSKLIREAREDDQVKAVVLRVNSPGGSVFPSELIRREVELTRAAGKPVVVSMGDVAASGGYWISMNGDQIIASPSTITGSIGIFGLWFNAPALMDKLGLNADGSSTTWINGAFDPRRPYDPRVGALIQTVIDRGYAQFIGKVGEARGKSSEEINKIARGRVWSGAQAKERGLVDRLGTFKDAIDEAASRAKLGDGYQLAYIEKEPTTFERFLADFSGSALAGAMKAHGWTLPATWLPKETQADMAKLKRLVDDANAHAPVVYADCECSIR